MMNTTELKEFAHLAQASYALLNKPAIYADDEPPNTQTKVLLQSSPNGGFAENQAVKLGLGSLALRVGGSGLKSNNESNWRIAV